MREVMVIGAGQLGSRHLQALKQVSEPLKITVVDPSGASLQTAKSRYDTVGSQVPHAVSYGAEIPRGDDVDIAIIATSANVRRHVVETLLRSRTVKKVILEKILFDARVDYDLVHGLLERHGAQAWINCPMRVMPDYQAIRQQLQPVPLSYGVTGGQYGLVTNAIHYLDHVAHITGCIEFELDTSRIDGCPIQSKRAGFLELTGTIVARFADGSHCEITCYANGMAPVLIEVFNSTQRFIVRESEGLAWWSTEDSGWRWQERPFKIPYQSELTTSVVSELLESGNCGLTPYHDSAQIHLSLLEPLMRAVRDHVPDASRYPFT